jgi:Zn-dependent protease with chaperone function
MKRKEFDELVRRMERRLAGRPASLERSATRWMALGLAGFLAWVALLFVLGFAAFVAGIVLPFEAGVWLLIVGVLILLFAISQAFVFLSVEHAPPKGHSLRATEAPGLHEVLGSLRRELQCPPFDDVRITMDFNAGIREVPRLGFLGWPRSILEIGLLLLEALTVAELRAVLAHEMAHGSGRHARSAGRIYRLHRTWAVLFERMQRPATGSFDRAIRAAASRFSGWYWPRLHARAMVLSRAHEYHADRVAAECAGAEVVVSALWRMECWQPMLAERFWEDVFREAERTPDPPADIMERMRSACQTPPAPADAARWVERGLSRTTGVDETHPSFGDRARALGVSAEDIRRIGFPLAAGPSAAQSLLGEYRGAIEAELAAE